MRRALIIAIAALHFNALALDAAALITPSPLGVVIAYRSFMKDQKKVYYIRVESQAQDFEKAKKQAFRLASEQVAGTVVLSESELRNSKLTRDEIITYSSGLIDEYRIVDRVDGPGYVKLVMEVWVAESVMAQRLLAKSATERGVDGLDLSTRAESILDEARRGDAVFGAIMRDFPARAFQVRAATPAVFMDAYRNTHVSVDVKIEWDRRFVNAFEDAARKTGRAPCRLGCPDPRFFIQGFEFNDVQKLNTIDQHIKATNSVVMIELQNIYGNPARRECYALNLQNTDFYTYYGNQLNLNSGRWQRSRLNLNLGQNTAAMAPLENIQVQIVPKSQCVSL